MSTVTTPTITDDSMNDVVESVVRRYGAKPNALIMILQDVQKHYRYLPPDVLKSTAREMNLPFAQIYGVATFYKSFSLEPKGKNHICVCTGTACHVRQADVIVDKMQRDLGIKPGETTPDKEFSLETVNCLGACALGPLVTANDVYYGNMTVSKVDKILDKLRGKETVEEAEAEEAA